MEKQLLKGNEAFILAAVNAGAKVFGGYPITPSSEGAHEASKLFLEDGFEFRQMESEVAVGHFLHGAGAAGKRVCTITSGPGYNWLNDGIVYAATAEVPILIENVGRAGPALGNITPSQSDYNMVVKGGANGDYHTIVLAPSTVQELVDFTFLGFEMADKWRNPVTILADGFIGQMTEAVVIPEPIVNLPDKTGWCVSGVKNRVPHQFIPFDLDTQGLIALNRRLQDKYRQIEAEEVRYEAVNLDNADILVVAFGLVGRIMETVIEEAEEQKIKVGLIRPQTLWPFPSKAIKEAAERIGTVLVVEMNYGQMFYDVKLAVEGTAPVCFYGEGGGWVPGVSDIVNEIKSVVKNISRFRRLHRILRRGWSWAKEIISQIQNWSFGLKNGGGK